MIPKVSCELRMRIHCSNCGTPYMIRSTFVPRIEVAECVIGSQLKSLLKALEDPCPVCSKKKLTQAEIWTENEPVKRDGYEWRRVKCRRKRR